MAIFVGDIGTELLINMGENISSASSVSLSVRKPDGTVVTWTPTIQGTLYLRYLTQSGDLNLAGEYAISPLLTIGSWTGRGETVYFKAIARFD